MMKLITLSPTIDIPTLLSQRGSAVEEGVPLGWLNSFALTCRAACADEQEADTAVVYGTEHLVVKVNHALTDQEMAIEKMQEAHAKIDAIARLLPREGESLSLSADQVAQLRQVLGL
jgi:hypothetical protein